MVSFWGYYFVQPWCAGWLVMFRWDSSLSPLLGVVVGWLGFPWFHVHFALGEVCWDVLMTACNANYNNIAEFHVLSGLELHLFILAIFCLVFLRHWFCFRFHYSILFGEMPLRWLVIFHMVPGLTFFFSTLYCFDFISAPTPLTFLWFWWQVSFSPTSHLQSQSLRCLYPLSLDQHVHMLCLHPWMLGHSFLGGWIMLWLMFLLSSNSAVGFVSCLLWTFLSFLLSLLLATKFAPTPVALHTCVCWHLDCVQTGRDDVRGKSPFVYDEDYSETKVFIFSSVLWLEFSGSWCPYLDLQLCPCLPKSKLELSFAARTFASGVKTSKSGQNILSLAYVSELWYLTKPVFTYVYSVLNGTIICIIGLFIILTVFPEFYFFGRAGIGLPWYIVIQ